MEEKKQKKTGLIVLIIILLICLLGSVGYIVYDKFISNVKDEVVKEETKETKEELDVNSRLVRYLYNKVSSEGKNDYGNWRFTKINSREENDFDVKTADEEIKMQLVGKLISPDGMINCEESSINKNLEKYKFGFESFCKSQAERQGNNNLNYFIPSYSKKTVEEAYKDLFGLDVKIDTSVKINDSIFGNYWLEYVKEFDQYVGVAVDGGGTTANSIETKLEKAERDNDTIKIYEIEKYKAPDKEVEETQYIYTFIKDKDEMYNFISRKAVK